MTFWYCGVTSVRRVRFDAIVQAPSLRDYKKIDFTETL